MCQARQQTESERGVLRSFPTQEKFEEWRSQMGHVLKGKGGKVKQAVMRSRGIQTNELRDQQPLSQRLLLSSIVVLIGCLVMNQVGLFVPIVMMTRNAILPKTPQLVRPKYPSCPDTMLADEMTIVVTVKDACSQAPGFIRSLEKFAPPSVHLIYTYPNFKSCAQINLKDVLKRWDKVTMLPLPLRSSPMQGWIDAIPHIKTKYSMLLHNDGYALDSFFGCELLRGLKYHQVNSPNASYIAAAPMLYESKMDGSLAAHATQTNLRIVADDSPQGITVAHDHSLRRALNRGNDFKEGPQTEFVEDHGFMIETDKIATVIDPKASFTLEYLDMIMTIRAKAWTVLFVPTARLEFRITEFSWRDIPYFMYKRSEATAHGTRDYLMAKWQASFPNTGFWTYIKYTIVEQHIYRLTADCSTHAEQSAAPCSELESMAWKDQAALVFGFFQMAGFNRYDISRGGRPQVIDFVEVLQKLDRGWSPSGRGVEATRELQRPAITKTRPSYVPHLDHILPYGKDSAVAADFQHEYLPFALAKLSLPTCSAISSEAESFCGLIVEQEGACTCWFNLPVFKSNSLLIRFLGRLAALVKIPSRVTTFLEMALAGSRDGSEHIAPLRALESPAFSVFACNIGEADCSLPFSFGKHDRLKLFRGAPATVPDVMGAVRSQL